MPRTGSAPGTNAWGLDTSATVATALIAVCAVALVAMLVWPAALAHGLSAFVVGLLFAAAGLDGIFELIGGFIWGGRSRYLRGAALMALALTYALLPA
jgi:hypothetical protein